MWGCQAIEPAIPGDRTASTEILRLAQDWHFWGQKRDKEIVKGWGAKEELGQVTQSGAGFVLCLVRILWSSVRTWRKMTFIIYDFKTISLATVCFAILLLQTPTIPAFIEHQKKWICSHCPKAHIVYQQATLLGQWTCASLSGWEHSPILSPLGMQSSSSIWLWDQWYFVGLICSLFFFIG